MLRHLSRRLLPAVSAAAAAGTSTPAALPTLPAAAGWAALHSPQSQRQQHRDWHGSAAAMHGGGGKGGEGGETIGVTFVEGDSERTVRVPLGKSLLEAAHDNDIELEGKHTGGTPYPAASFLILSHPGEPHQYHIAATNMASGAGGVISSPPSVPPCLTYRYLCTSAIPRATSSAAGVVAQRQPAHGWVGPA